MAAAPAPLNPMHNLLRVSAIHDQTYPNSHSYRVTAEDGAPYMMKVFPVGLAPMLCHREVLANELGNLLGFSMARWNILQLDGQTRQEHLDGNRDTGLNREKLSPGLYFGTRVAEGPGSLRLFLSEALIRVNPEVARQLGCVRLFDVWLAHAGFRRFASLGEKNVPAHVYFFGHSRVLCPEQPDAFEGRVSSAYKTACSIAGNAQVVEDFLERLRRIAGAQVRKAIDTVPWVWQQPCWDEKAARMLASRRDRMVAVRRKQSVLPQAPTLFSTPALLCDTGHVINTRQSTLAI